jgi:hypothetical protein
MWYILYEGRGFIHVCFIRVWFYKSIENYKAKTVYLLKIKECANAKDKTLKTNIPGFWKEYSQRFIHISDFDEIYKLYSIYRIRHDFLSPFILLNHITHIYRIKSDYIQT